MIQASDIRTSLARFFEEEVEVVNEAEGVAVLTPVEYPDGDAVVVWVRERRSGEFEITDLGQGDARLYPLGPGLRAITPAASVLAQRAGGVFDQGVIRARTTPEQVAWTCWQVAQASAAVAEAPLFYREQAPREAAFVDLVEREVRSQVTGLQIEPELPGASGHTYRPTLYVPLWETILEPVTGERAWNKAAAVYVEFGDLSAVNGYKLVAVLDDREETPAPEIEALLGQVAAVARWSRKAEWLQRLTGGGFV